MFWILHPSAAGTTPELEDMKKEPRGLTLCCVSPFGRGVVDDFRAIAARAYAQHQLFCALQNIVSPPF